uniref:Uncharacterized protein n=1 Tax=Anguilla anguilla TaxID=7936 RepID=A0A0E9WFT8_ANGAN
MRYLTFCGTCPRAEAIVFLLSLVRFFTIEPKENTTTPSSPEVCTNSSMSSGRGLAAYNEGHQQI